MGKREFVKEYEEVFEAADYTTCVAIGMFPLVRTPYSYKSIKKFSLGKKIYAAYRP